MEWSARALLCCSRANLGSMDPYTYYVHISSCIRIVQDSTRCQILCIGGILGVEPSKKTLYTTTRHSWLHSNVAIHIHTYIYASLSLYKLSSHPRTTPMYFVLYVLSLYFPRKSIWPTRAFFSFSFLLPFSREVGKREKFPIFICRD